MRKLVEMFFACKHAVQQVPSSLVSKAQKDDVLRVFQQITGASIDLLTTEDIDNAVQQAIQYIDGQSKDSHWKCTYLPTFF